MIQNLISLFTKRRSDKVGNLPPPITPINPFYAEKDQQNRWQGDIYQGSSFPVSILPSDRIPYWILLNRTCHLYESEGRKIKLPYLNFAAVYPIEDFIDYSPQAKTIKNQVDIIINEHEGAIFLPAYEPHGILKPLVANLNLIYTVSVDKCPKPSKKILQLSSPFSEHAFQKFASYFYTVGFDDSLIKSKDYIKKLCNDLETNKPAGNA